VIGRSQNSMPCQFSSAMWRANHAGDSYSRGRGH
jgi:hypothetical protein